MRLALISDLHGNLTALDAVLGDIDKRKVDAIVCLGDVASDGPQPRQVLARLRHLRCPVIMGNGDAQLIGREPIDPDPAMKVFADAAAWTTVQLSGADRAFVESFVESLAFDLDGRPALLFHGSPSDFNEQLLPGSDDETFRTAFEGRSATLYAGGHTHLQMVRRIDEALFVNPGSVGMAYDRPPGGPTRVRFAAWAEYAILTSTSKELGCELRRVAYDPVDVIEAVRAAQPPNVDWWITAWSRATRL